MSLIFVYLFGVGIGLLISALISKSRKDLPEGQVKYGWKKIRDFDDVYYSYCNQSGCDKDKIQEPFDFGFCAKHREKYWKKQLLPVEVKQPEEYKAYTWMEK